MTEFEYVMDLLKRISDIGITQEEETCCGIMETRHPIMDEIEKYIKEK
jgi:hypothetical protein